MCCEEVHYFPKLLNLICSSDELVDIISQLISESSIDIKQPSHVMFARDTRLVFCSSNLIT